MIWKTTCARVAKHDDCAIDKSCVRKVEPKESTSRSQGLNQCVECHELRLMTHEMSDDGQDDEDCAEDDDVDKDGHEDEDGD